MLIIIARSIPEKKTKNPTFLGKNFITENSYRIIAKTKRTRVLSEEKCQKDTTRLSKSRV